LADLTLQNPFGGKSTLINLKLINSFVFLSVLDSGIPCQVIVNILPFCLSAFGKIIKNSMIKTHGDLNPYSTEIVNCK